jgi:hypothetical protein
MITQNLIEGEYRFLSKSAFAGYFFLANQLMVIAFE